MDILVIGGGGREHAIIMSLAKSKKTGKLWCAPGNGGISAYAECFPKIKATDLDGILALANELKPDLVFVAPDDPLVMGLVDLLNENGFKTFGPNKAAAIIEGSKAFSKELMRKYGIPTAGYELFDKASEALNYILARNSYPTVIKADGLALGKGVIIAADFVEAEAAVKSIMEDKVFGASGSRIVVEDFLTGPEVSVLSFTDGKTVVPMISSMDHKRALDNDKGLNTGGMGTVAPNPFFTPEKQAEAMEKILLPTIRAMAAEGRPFSGCLYFGLMLTADGVKVIEYNCRFGDPEAQVVLPLLETDLVDIILAIDEQKLDSLELSWKKESAVCVVIASGGYPQSYDTGFAISGLDERFQKDGAIVFHAGTRLEDGTLVTSGGRVLGVTATGATLSQARESAYSAAEGISFNAAFMRHDIGKKALTVSSEKHE